MPRGPIQLHSWLRRAPVPTRIRLDGTTIVPIGNGRSKWTDALSVVEEHDAQVVEALDDAGGVLRSTRLGAGRHDVGAPLCDEPASPVDVPRSDLGELARLIAEAGDRGAQRHAAAYELAFARMTDLVTILAERLGGLERAWQATLEARAADLAASPASDDAGGAVASMLGAVLSGQHRSAPVPIAAARKAGA